MVKALCGTIQHCNYTIGTFLFEYASICIVIAKSSTTWQAIEIEPSVVSILVTRSNLAIVLHICVLSPTQILYSRRSL